MREFKTTFGGTVDLDDPNTYKHLSDDTADLDDLMFKEIGMALAYMDYFRPEFFEDKDGGQRKRVNALIKDYCDNRKHNWHSALWFKEKIFRFQEEVENMC